MLKEKAMIKIGKEECIAMLGKENVEKHRDLCCLFHGMDDDRFTVGIGMDTKGKTDVGITFGNTKMEYYAIVKIDPKDGTVYRDMENSILPQ